MLLLKRTIESSQKFIVRVTVLKTTVDLSILKNIIYTKIKTFLNKPFSVKASEMSCINFNKIV